ncbi:MAG: polysaccharide pyruvyl transferase family protein [Calothrix sp. MO_192.B10]|nr:polysaccharide pyruvyl transferase family protein [Calothrix sp. MO_192.B10]
MKICLFDPGVEKNDGTPSANLGDLIIQESVEQEIQSLFKVSEIVRISTHIFPQEEHIDYARNCPFAFVGGTNLLSSQMNRYRKWQFSWRQQLKIRKTILLGVGWQTYQDKPNFQTGLILKSILSNHLMHSVRDSYTERQLRSIGIKNVLNTGCPTMWSLADIKPQEITSVKSDNALVMVTDYAKNPELDKKLLELVLSKYRKVFAWSQGRGDFEYISDLTSNLERSITIIEHSYDAFKHFLNSGIWFDYIGTRLHGGIKCLHHKRRALVIEIDNRAKEISKDTNLPTAAREEFEKISQWIDGSTRTTININLAAINQWRTQFNKTIATNKQ